MVGKWPVKRPRRGPRDPRRHRCRHRLTAAAVFFLDATKKYGRIITSFVVVPFALLGARVVKSADVNPPVPSTIPPPPARSTVFLPRRCGRLCQIFIAPTSLSRAGSHIRLTLYGIEAMRKRERKREGVNFMPCDCIDVASPMDIDRLQRIMMIIVYKCDNKSNKI